MLGERGDGLFGRVAAGTMIQTARGEASRARDPRAIPRRGATARQRLHRIGAAVPHHDLVAAGHETACHVATHSTEADQA